STRPAAFPCSSTTAASSPSRSPSSSTSMRCSTARSCCRRTLWRAPTLAPSLSTWPAASSRCRLRTTRRVDEIAGKGKGAEWNAYWLKRGLEEFEEIAKKTAGKYSVGDAVTIGDVTLPSILY
ncbi:hypothetical protein PENTCL1PPCAC_3858, partial [Pristionchus entomophagus]